jgi:hypothetical protein
MPEEAFIARDEYWKSTLLKPNKKLSCLPYICVVKQNYFCKLKVDESLRIWRTW